MPQSLIEKLNADLVRVLTSSETREGFAAAGADIARSTPEEFRAFVVAEQIKWEKVIRETGIRVELER